MKETDSYQDGTSSKLTKSEANIYSAVPISSVHLVPN